VLTPAYHKHLQLFLWAKETGAQWMKKFDSRGREDFATDGNTLTEGMRG